MKVALFALGLVVTLSACALPAPVGQGLPQAGASDAAHTSRHALDWAGSYEGITPCADCPGIKTRLTLHSNGSYERTTEYLDRPSAPKTVRGRVTWHRTGNALTLDAAGHGQHFAVGEGRLTMLYRDGAQPAGALAARHVLTKRPEN